MKQDNSFLFSYIVFITICGIARFWGEYSQWNALVSAITISGVLLTCGEYFSIYEKYFYKIWSEDIAFVNDRKNKLKKEKNIVFQLQEKLKNLTSTKSSFMEDIDKYYTILHGYDQIDSAIKKIESTIQINAKKQKAASLLAIFFKILAFCSFLCILTFPGLAQEMRKVQDSLSVWAFLIILAIPYISQRYSESLKYIEVQRNNINTSIDYQRQEILNNCNQRISELQQIADWQEELQEDKKNAD